MKIEVKKIWKRILRFLHLSPLTLAEKCRVAFGMAVLLVLALALLLPYIWMKQLTRQGSISAGRARTEILLSRHFKLHNSEQAALPELNRFGDVSDANDNEISWIRFDKDSEKDLAGLNKTQRKLVASLKDQQSKIEDIVLEKHNRDRYINYAKVFRANERCISCHNPEGSAGAFAPNELVGIAVVRQLSTDILWTGFMNSLVTILAGLIASAGAVIAFYIITQRVILSPIRQLRSLANNVSEGNLEIRSSIKTGDEFERLSDAFNHMLEGLQVSQEKLRQANKQLDNKIVELSERNIELFKANKVKGEFLANMSHEFRTPLNSILGFAEILHERPLTLTKEKSKRYAENIITGGKRLLNMINDLLDMAKTEAGKMQLHIDNCSVKELCENLVSSFSIMTIKKKIKVRLKIDPEIPVLTTDSGKVQQIMYNFMSNAVKFTDKRGRIEISATMPDEKHVRLSVSDTGCGISQADHEVIFEKFRQSDGSLTRQTTGSGLGLAICKELSLMLAGSVGLESQSEQGATFWLEIPIDLSKPEDNV